MDITEEQITAFSDTLYDIGSRPHGYDRTQLRNILAAVAPMIAGAEDGVLARIGRRLIAENGKRYGDDAIAACIVGEAILKEIGIDPDAEVEDGA